MQEVKLKNPFLSSLAVEYSSRLSSAVTNLPSGALHSGLPTQNVRCIYVAGTVHKFFPGHPLHPLPCGISGAFCSQIHKCMSQIVRLVLELHLRQPRQFFQSSGASYDGYTWATACPQSSSSGHGLLAAYLRHEDHLGRSPLITTIFSLLRLPRLEAILN